MKAKFFLFIIAALMVFMGFYGCGLNIPDDTKQLNLTGPSNLSVGNQPAVGDFNASALDNDAILIDKKKEYGTSPVLPYTWTVACYNGNQLVKLLEDYSGANYQVKFYKPGRYLITVDLRQGFGSGTVVNAEVWTGRQIEVNVTQGSGYSTSNFTPGIIISTSTGAAVMSITEIKVIRDWGATTTYNPPVDNNLPNSDSRAGNAILSFDEVRGQRNGQIFATLSVEGLLDNLSIDGVYYDKTLLTLKAINAIPGSGWSIYSQGLESRFTATNSSPQSGKVASFKFLFDTKNIAGTTGITWGSAVMSGSYKKDVVSLTGIDGWLKVE